MNQRSDASICREKSAGSIVTGRCRICGDGGTFRACADNDGRLACYAEWRAGAGRGVDNLSFSRSAPASVPAWCWMGGCSPIGISSAAPNVGHLVIDLEGPSLPDRRGGVAESLASITALVR